MRNATDQKTALYRIWGDDGLLLYIGISNSFGKRWNTHARQQPWWGEMRRLTADEWYETRPEARAAEEAAIKAERPKYNKVYAVPDIQAPVLPPKKRGPSTGHAPVPFRQCWCRDPQTGKKLNRNCPKLARRDHGYWYVRYTIPPDALDYDPARKRNQRQIGPFPSKREASDELAGILDGYVRAGFRVMYRAS